MLEQYVIIGTITPADDADRAGIRVQAFDRDLPSRERRLGLAPQSLGEAVADADGRFQITYTLDQFRAGEAISPMRRSRKQNADLSFRVFDQAGQELGIRSIEALNRGFGPDEIIFNAPAELEVSIFVASAQEAGDSEYEHLLALIAPVVEDLPLTEISDEDVVFLINELGLEQQREAQQRIEWLRRSAWLAAGAALPIEAFYGWGRVNIPADFAALADHPLVEWQSLLTKFLAETDDRLRDGLRTAISDKISPDLGDDRIGAIMAQMMRLKVDRGFLAARRFVGKLLDERSGQPLVGLIVRGFDLDAGQEPRDLGQNVSNSEGVFALSYITPPTPAGADPNQALRRLRLQILVDPQTQEKFETEVRAGGDQEILDIPVLIPAQEEPPTHQLDTLTATLQLALPPDLLPFLSGKNINTLADIRKAGGIRHLQGLPVAVDDPSVQLLEAHADLSRVSSDVEVNAAMIRNRFDSVAAIAKASRPDFVGAMRDQVGDYNAANFQVAARAQTHFLNNLVFKTLADQANGAVVDPIVADQMRCHCPDCEAAVSPLAYLADLLKYVTENVKNNNVLIKAADLAAIFHQPFDLPASCEAVDIQIHQVRLCVEVLRSYLGVRPLADTTQEGNLAQAEKDYRLAAYVTLLTKIGTTYAELRLSRTSEPSLRQSLADRLGIDLSHLNALLLDPDAVPEGLTEAALEQLFGLADTTRDPLAPAATPVFQTWRLEYLRTLWRTQDSPTDSYEDGRNVVGLKQLPAGVTFAPPLDAKISYDVDRQQLVCQGEMTEDERSTLLTLSSDLSYQHAVKQLFQISQRLPIVDPDLIGPDDFRRPSLKANPGDPDQAFDLWKKRRDWVDSRLQAFSGLTKVIAGQPQPVPDLAAMIAAMYQPVTYDATSLTAWANTTPSADFETLLSLLAQGIDVDAIKFRLQDDLHLTIESFTRLMAIAAKATSWENDPRGDQVKDDEWHEIHSILVQAQKIKLFAAWRKEESDAGVQLDPHTFWLALRQPQEGEWPPLGAQRPWIDPAVLKLVDLPEPVAGERAIALWKARQARLEQIPQDLATERQFNGFDAMLRLALGHPNPGNPLQHDLATLKADLSNPDPTVAASAAAKITDDLHLTVESFKRLLAIKAKHEDPDLSKKPTAAEWAELFALLTPARRIKHEFPTWINEEQDPLTGVVYWNALKAKLARWRASGENRQFWLQALRNRSQSPLVDPDLIGPADLKNPVPGDAAFDLWKARDGEISTQLAQFAAEPRTVAGLDANLRSTLGMSVVQLLAIAEAQEKGNTIGDRLAQLSLEVAEYNYLLRITRLANQAQPILALEWENVYSILIQVWKRRQFARWRKAEQDQDVLLGSDFFQIPPSTAIPFPPKEPTINDRWRSSRASFQDWQDKLQSRLDQEQTIVQAVAEAVNTTEEATLPMLRDSLILATSFPGDLETKAKWVAENLLVDTRMSGCSMTTRVAQAIETLQGLVLTLRTGQLEDLYRTFKLTLDNFDEKWKWLGSYASWRAAMFVFLYPENILQPILRRWQTPAFQALADETRSSKNLTPDNACTLAKRYAEYFQDICTLRVEASCTSRTRLFRDDACSQTDNGYRCMLYLFGRGGLTGKVYWSALDFQDSSGYSQMFWTPVQGADGNYLKDLEHIEDVIGAVPYQTSTDQRFIFLFVQKRDALSKKIICVKYDLENQTENQTWQSEAIVLDVSAQTPRGFTVKVKQQDFENSPPQIIISPPLGLSGQGTFELRLSSDGKGWENQTPFRFANTEVSGVVGIDNNSFYLINYGASVLTCSLFVPINDPRPVYKLVADARYKEVAVHAFGEKPPGGLSLAQNVGRYLGAFSWPESNSLYVVTGDIRPGYRARVWQIRDNGSQQLEVMEVHSPFGASEPSVIPTSGLVEDNTAKSKRIVYRVDTDDPSLTMQMNRGRGPTSISFQGNFSQATNVDRFIRYPEGGLYPTGPRPVTPSVSGPFNIPAQLSAQDLLIRKALVEQAFARNKTASLSHLTYLEEAYYFVPVHLALALQKRGEYHAALGWLRTVYDYLAEASKRKVYYGLIAEESLAGTYKRGKDWLLDPLNPHAIAATRQHTYTRFTLLAIVRCLLDYADAEFTQDSAESNARARRSYLTALELLGTPELQQSPNKCDEIVGVLDDIPIPDNRWQIHLQQIKSELKQIPDPQRLQSVVDQVKQALIPGLGMEQRLANARTVIDEAKAALPPTPNLTTVIQQSEVFSHEIQRFAVSDSDLAAALESVSAIATEDFQRTVTMVTGISPARLEQRAIDLRWLGEPVLLATNAAEVQPATNLAHARRDVAQLDILAPTYVATLAQVAALQPMIAVNLAAHVQEIHIPQLIVGFCIPSNPLLTSMRLRAELNLHKLRTCHNIAGLKRQVDPYAAPTDTTSGLPQISAGGQLLLPGVVRLQPTLYRYPVLIERAKLLVQLAGQIEATLLSTLEKRDNEAHSLLRARQDLSLAQAGIRLQTLRLSEADHGTKLAVLQQTRAQIQADHYRKLIDEDLSQLELDGIGYLQDAVGHYDDAVVFLGWAAAFYFAQVIGGAIAGGMLGSVQGPAGTGLGAIGGGIAGALQNTASVASGLSALSSMQATKAQRQATRGTIASTLASFERRKQDWEFQGTLAQQDIAIGAEQITLAGDHVEIVGQEKVIAELQTSNAKDTIEFLTTKFTNVDLYDWMSDVLEGVYRFFLQQATAVAKLAENQLAFERQEVPPAYIQADYWNAPADGVVSSAPNKPLPDRKGLTGSARLLQDVYQLDQHAFNTNRRKLQLTKTFSLALLAPAEFQRFRETGVMIFATQMRLFDRDFPGHYLRLTHRVRTSVIALIPPTQGIHATLSFAGLSRTVIGPDVFQTVPIRRDPEFVALTSSANATGLFELEPLQPEMLHPFEGNGVDTTWELRMPKAANQFDYRTIADVLITIEYTALHSFDYRQQVIRTLNPNLSAERPFSFRNQFADQWYDLHNLDQTKTPMTVRFQTVREDFPPNVENLKIQQVLLYFVRMDGASSEVPVGHLRYTAQGEAAPVGGSAASIDGVISTRRGNAGSWIGMIGKYPVGEWDLALPNTEEIRNRFRNEEISDILLVLTYSGRTPEWPD